jgi:hypothetical protein
MCNAVATGSTAIKTKMNTNVSIHVYSEKLRVCVVYVND